MKVLERVPVYPFLIAVYPIFFLLSVNRDEIEVSAGLRTVLLLLLICMAVFLFSLLLSRSVNRAGAISLFIVLVFFLIFFVVYAPAYRALREVTISGQVLGRHRYLVPATLLIILVSEGLAVWLVRKINEKKLRIFTFGVNCLGIILILIPITTLVIFSLKKGSESAQIQKTLPVIEQPLAPVSASSPDVYYIILDMHTSDHVLAKELNDSDSGFSDALREKGFFVAACSQSNYSSTQLSITSSLNIDFLQNITDSVESPTLYPLLQNSRVQRSLEESGYKTYAFETGYSFSDLVDAHRFYKPVSGAWDLLAFPGLTPFESLVMQVSAGKILYESRDQLSERMQYIIDASYVQYRDRILFTLDTLPNLVTEPGPKFVFAHILAPHDPFVFDEDGSTAFRRTPFALNEDPEFGKGYGWKPYSVAYMKELKYLHKRILKIVEEIQAKSTTPPIIIIQGDHGIPRSAIVNAQFEIYNAIYMKDVKDSGFYDTITPVNSFRLIFNQAFGTTYSLLPDDSYMYDKIGKVFIPFTTPIDCP